MPFSHYPKTVSNIVFALVQPAPPNIDPPRGRPSFLGMPFSALNRFSAPLAPNESVVGYHDAQPFTRFYGSIASDQALDVSLLFSNDEVDAEGVLANDNNLKDFHYDAHGAQQSYDPTKQAQTGKIFSMIFGRWLRIEVKNAGDKAPTFLRCYIRGSVF